MPNIQEYRSQVQSAGPVNIRRAGAEDFGGGLAAGAGALGEGLQDASKTIKTFEDRREISDLHSRLSALKAESSVELTNRLKNAKPGDPDFTQNFLDDYNEKVGKIEEGISSNVARQFFNEQNAQIKGSIYESSFAAQTHLAEQKAVLDVTESAKHLANDAYTIPNNWKTNLSLNNSFIDSMNLSEPKKQELKMQLNGHITEMAVRGRILSAAGSTDYVNELAGVQKDLESGFYDNDLDPDKKHAMFVDVRVSREAKRTEEHQRLQDEKLAGEIRSEAQKIKWTKASIGGKPPSLKELMESKDVSSSDLEHYFKFAQSEKGRQDSRVVNGYYSRIHQLDNDYTKKNSAPVTINELWEAKARNELTRENVDYLISELTGKRDPNVKAMTQDEKAFDRLAQSTFLDGNLLLPGAKQDAERRLYDFRMYIKEKKQEYTDKGLSLSGLFSPNSKEWLGHSLEKFTAKPQDMVRDAYNRYGGGAKNAPSMNDTLVNPPNRVPKSGEMPADLEQQGGKKGVYKQALDKALAPDPKKIFKRSSYDPVTGTSHEVTIDNNKKSPVEVSQIEKRVKEYYADYLDFKKDPSKFSVFEASRLTDMFSEFDPTYNEFYVDKIARPVTPKAKAELTEKLNAKKAASTKRPLTRAEEILKAYGAE